MAEVALDPRAIVSDVGDRARDLGADDAPILLSRAIGTAPPFPPVREDEDLLALHQEWARLHEGDDRPAGAASGVRGRIRGRVAATAAEASGPGHRENRALIGALIRATEALAVRCDELAGRVADLEDVLEEVVNVVSEDLVHVRAALGPAAAGPTARPGAGGERPHGGNGATEGE